MSKDLLQKFLKAKCTKFKCKPGYFLCFKLRNFVPDSRECFYEKPNCDIEMAQIKLAIQVMM